MATPQYQASDPLEIPGVGQFHTHIVEDAASLADYYLATGMDPAFVWQSLGQELQRMVAMKNWRSVAANNIIVRIKCETLPDLISPEEISTTPSG